MGLSWTPCLFTNTKKGNVAHQKYCGLWYRVDRAEMTSSDGVHVLLLGGRSTQEHVAAGGPVHQPLKQPELLRIDDSCQVPQACEAARGALTFRAADNALVIPTEPGRRQAEDFVVPRDAVDMKMQSQKMAG